MAAVPSPHRQRTSFFPTPLIGDVLFSERVVCQTKAVPAYGTAHPNTARWPNHKLVFAKERPEPESVDSFDFYYAADRASQDSYNFSHTEADIGGTRFDAVARTYVTRRSAFTPNTPAMGAAMPNVPAGLFPGSHVLAEKRQTRIGEQELDSLYVAETHVYVKRATLSAVKMDEQTGRVKKSVTNLYYRGETISGTAVETLAASPTNAYWGQQTDGVFRELDQLSENWFAIIESNVIPDGSINSSGNPAKTRVVNRVTPLGTDLYFTEVGAMPATVPAYGSTHYDAATWPNHKLSLISPADASGLLFTFHYVADRSSQDNYNFSSSQADIGGQKFDTIQRSYLVPRATFVEETTAMGSVMPDVPAESFGAGFVLASEEQRRVGDPQFDNLYVTIERTYVRKVTLGEIGFDEKTGRSTSSTVTLLYLTETVSGTPIETLFADKDNAYWGLQTSGVFRTVEQLSEKWFAVTERSVLPESSINATGNPAKTRVINRVTPLGTDIYFTEVGAMPASIPAYGSAHYDLANWPNHKLSLISPADASGLLFTFHYVADRANQDLYNFSHTKADIGGTKFDAVARTYVTLRSAFTPNSPAMGATMPNTPAGLFPGDYVLAEKRQTRIGEQELDSLYVAETHVYVKRCTITQLGIDPINGEVLTSTSTLYYASEAVTGSTTAATLFATPSSAYWGLQSTGVQHTGKQLSCEWYEIVSEVVVAGTFSSGAVTIRSYSTTQNYYWPPILDYIDIALWTRRNGTQQRYARPIYVKEGYRGECRTDIVDTFHVTAPGSTTPDVMLPLPISISNPFYSISIGPCLFAGATYSFTNGTTDPEFVYTVASYALPATSPVTWPNFVTIVNVQPFRGGYLKSTIKIYKPS